MPGLKLAISEINIPACDSHQRGTSSIIEMLRRLQLQCGRSGFVETIGELTVDSFH